MIHLFEEPHLKKMGQPHVESLSKNKELTKSEATGLADLRPVFAPGIIF